MGEALDERLALVAFFLLFKRPETESANSLGKCFGSGCMPITVFTLEVFVKLLLRRKKNNRGLANVALERPERLPVLGKIDGHVDIFTHSIVVPHMIFSI